MFPIHSILIWKYIVLLFYIFEANCHFKFEILVVFHKDFLEEFLRLNLVTNWILFMEMIYFQSISYHKFLIYFQNLRKVLCPLLIHNIILLNSIYQLFHHNNLHSLFQEGHNLMFHKKFVFSLINMYIQKRRIGCPSEIW